MKNEKFAPKPAKGAIKHAKDFARISDIALTLVFAYLAYTNVEKGGFWFWFWVASSLFCLVAVFRSPIDMMWNAINGRLYGAKKA